MKVIITNTAECQIAETADYIEQAWGRVNKIKFRKKYKKLSVFCVRTPISEH